MPTAKPSGRLWTKRTRKTRPEVRAPGPLRPMKPASGPKRRRATSEEADARRARPATTSTADPSSVAGISRPATAATAHHPGGEAEQERRQRGGAAPEQEHRDRAQTRGKRGAAGGEQQDDYLGIARSYPRPRRASDRCIGSLLYSPGRGWVERSGAGRSAWATGRRPTTYGRPDLPPGQPAPARAAPARAHQAAAARPLGHLARVSTCLRAPQPADPRDRPGRALRRRPGPRRPRPRRQRLPRGHLLGDLPGGLPRPRRLRRLFRQFSTPGGIPSHVSVPTPGSIHEGGELGYALVHAFGAAFDNPDLLVACVIGDGEAETGPLEGSWKGVRLPQPGARRRGAADPAPERVQDLGPDGARSGVRRRHRAAAAGHGYDPVFVEGGEAPAVSPHFAPALTDCLAPIRRDPGRRAERRCRGAPALAGDRPAHPEGLDRSRGGRRRPGRGHVPRPSGAPSGVRENPEHLAMLEAWLRSYRPDEHFDEDGRLVPELAALRSGGREAHGREPAGNGGRASSRWRSPTLVRLRDRRSPCRAGRAESTTRLGGCCATSRTQPRPASAYSAPTRPTPTGSAPSSRSMTAA